MAELKLVTIHQGSEGSVGAVLDGEVLDFAMTASHFPLASWVPATLVKAISGGTEAMAILSRLVAQVAGSASWVLDDLRATGALVPLDRVVLKAPIPRPTILLSHARAYRDHVTEMAKGGESPPEYPIGFLKNGHAVIGCNAPISLPRSADAMVDFEGEISIVFARPCHGITASEALDHVLGVTIVNDVSARDWVPEIKAFPDRNRMGKQFPGFAPMGPWITTLDEIADVDDLHLVTRLNGQVMQDARSSDLIWSLAELIAYYARWYPFQPGDVLTTGSPAGVGYGRNPKVFLKPGDTVSISVDGVGTLSNPIVAPTETTRIQSTSRAGARQ